MSTKSTATGPFTRVWVGPAGDSSVLKPLLTTRTGGGFLRYDVPSEFLAVKGRPEQSGTATMSLSLKFYGRDSNILKLAMNNPLSQANDDDPSTQANYTVLLLHPSAGPYSVLLPNVWTDITIDQNFEQTAFLRLPIMFRAENPDRHINLFYQRTPAALKSILGSRCPF